MPEGSHQTSSIEAMLHIRAGQLMGHQGMQPQTQTEAACLALGCAAHEGSAPQRTQGRLDWRAIRSQTHFIKQLEWKHTYVHLHNLMYSQNTIFIVQMRCIGTVQVSLWCECALTSASEGSWLAISCAISTLSCSAPTLSTAMVHPAPSCSPLPTGWQAPAGGRTWSYWQPGPYPLTSAEQNKYWNT